jgi:hypothetical protein
MAIKANIIVDQGSTYSTSINLTDDGDNPLDLTTFTGAAQFRRHYTSTTAVSFNVTLGGANGTLTLALSANATANVTPGRYMYDAELTDSSNNITRVVEGIITITPNITR